MCVTPKPNSSMNMLRNRCNNRSPRLNSTFSGALCNGVGIKICLVLCVEAVLSLLCVLLSPLNNGESYLISAGG